MSASQDQTPLSQARGAGTTYGPDDTTSSDNATSGMSQGSATAFGQGPHPDDKDADTSNVTMPGIRGGPQQEDLDGEQMAAPGEGDVMAAQFNKQGQGEEPSLTSDLDRKKAEQASAREEIKEAREGGQNVDGGAGGRVESEGMRDV